jgi:hypothetical protein
MGSTNIQTSISTDSQPNIVPVQSPSVEQSILQLGEITNTNGNVEESLDEGISSSVVEAPKSITYIHFREIPKDSLKTSHIGIILGPERATRPGEIGQYAIDIQERKTALRIWGIAEVSICCKANLCWCW